MGYGEQIRIYFEDLGKQQVQQYGSHQIKAIKPIIFRLVRLNRAWISNIEAMMMLKTRIKYIPNSNVFGISLIFFTKEAAIAKW